MRTSARRVLRHQLIVPIVMAAPPAGQPLPLGPRTGIDGICRTLITIPGIPGQTECSGLLSYVRGQWVHVDACPECYARPGADCAFAPWHRRCDSAEVLTCVHEADPWHCAAPAQVDARCAYGMADRTCCGCCWVPPDQDEEASTWLA